MKLLYLLGICVVLLVLPLTSCLNKNHAPLRYSDMDLFTTNDGYLHGIYKKKERAWKTDLGGPLLYSSSSGVDNNSTIVPLQNGELIFLDNDNKNIALKETRLNIKDVIKIAEKSGNFYFTSQGTMIFATKTVNSPFGIDVASGEPISSSLDSSASLPVYFVRTDYRITGRGRDGGVPLFEIVYSTVTPMGTNSGGATLESQANHWPNQTIFSSRTSLQCVAGGDPHAPQSTLRFLESSTQNNVGGAQWNVLSSRDMHSLTERSSSALEEVAEWSTVRSVAVTQRTTEYSATDEEDSSVLVNDTSVTITTVSDASIVLNATVLAAFSLAEVMEEETSSAVSSLPYVYASVPIAYVTNATRTSEKRSSSPHQSYPLYCVDYNVLTGSSMTVQVLYDLSNTNGVVSEYEQLLAPIARAKRALQTSPSWAFVQEGLVTWRVEESQPDPPSAEEPSPVYGVYEVGDGMTERRYAVHFSDRAACRLQWMHNSTWGTRWNTSSSPVISATFSHPEYPYIYRTCAEHSPELMDLLDNAASGSCSDSTEVVNNIFKQDYLLQKRLTQPTVPTAHVVNAYYRGSIPLLSASDNESRDIADSARLVPDLTAKAPSGETAATRRRTSMFQGDPEDSAITNPIAVVRPGELNTVLDRGVHRLSPSRFEAIVESCSRPAGSPSEDPLSRLLPQDKELCQALVSEVVAVQQEQAMDPLASYSMEELLQHPLVDFQATYDMNRWWCEGEATDDASMMRCILREWFLQEMDLRKRSMYYHSLHPIQDPRVRGEYYVVPTEPIATVRSRRSSSEYAGYALDHAAEDPTTFSMERVVRYRDVPTMGRLSSTRRWQHSDRPPLSLPQIEEPPLVLALPEQQLPAAVSQPFRRREGWAMHAEKSREAVFNFVVVPVSLLLSAAMLLAGSILRGIYLYQVWKQGAEGRDERTGLLLSMYVGLMEQLTSMLCRLADSMLATAQRQMLYRALLLESDSAETAVANESSSGPAHEYPKTVTIDGTAVVMISPELVMYPDHVVGRGSHGTLVCKGLWHNKIPVAVKQMLALYQSYASREITTLVELSGGDGHPNIVKYFYASQALVHQQADGSGAAVHQSSAFVYLALQLCQMSLKDFVVALARRRKHADDLIPVVTAEVREALRQMACGLQHLHSKKIIHRDIKPGNILLMPTSRRPGTGDDGEESDVAACVAEEGVVCIGRYVLKISDMGLCKQIEHAEGSFHEPSRSFLVSSTVYRSRRDADPAMAVARSELTVAGTTGWQAPELLKLKYAKLQSVHEGASEEDSSVPPVPVDDGTDTPMPDATSADHSSVDPFHFYASGDIFSLGCVFFYLVMQGASWLRGVFLTRRDVAVVGDHPFGEVYEREANVLRGQHVLLTEAEALAHGRPVSSSVQRLAQTFPDCFDLIRRMVSAEDPLHASPSRRRPNIEEVLSHPFFWSPTKRAEFLIEFSDLVEHLVTSLAVSEGGSKGSRSPTSTSSQGKVLELLHLLESNAGAVVGTGWNQRIHAQLLEDGVKYRKYDYASVRDCLRLLRNKKHHYYELSDECKAMLHAETAGRAEGKPSAIDLVQYFDAKFPHLLLHCVSVACTSVSKHEAVYKHFCHGNARLFRIPAEQLPRVTLPTDVSPGDDHGPGEGIASSGPAVVPSPSVVYWQGSVLAAAGSENPRRGWYRPASHWVESGRTAVDPHGYLSLSLSNHLKKSIDDTLSKRGMASGRINRGGYRSILCAHWVESNGTHCPMKQKGKCGFAHGPLEIRENIAAFDISIPRTTIPATEPTNARVRAGEKRRSGPAGKPSPDPYSAMYIEGGYEPYAPHDPRWSYT